MLLFWSSQILTRTALRMTDAPDSMRTGRFFNLKGLNFDDRILRQDGVRPASRAIAANACHDEGVRI